MRISWNNSVKLILADVDETIADVYTNAVPEMILELTQILKEGKSIFFITGAGFQSVYERIIDFIPKEYRKKILIAHCSGAEVCGFDEKGDVNKEPYYSVYDKKMNEDQKLEWRRLIDQLVGRYGLETNPTMPVKEFQKKVGNNPQAVMKADRGPQITLEFVNAYDLNDEQVKELQNKLNIIIPKTHGTYDLRIPVFEQAEKLFQSAGLPITPRLGGIFALDFALEGVSKTEAIKQILGNSDILETLGLTLKDLEEPKNIEIWGDKFTIRKGGLDRQMSEAVNPLVRSIDFRQEDIEEVQGEYNIFIWDGKHHLHNGLLEYLQSRKNK